jgi:hypothetical protein
MLSSKIRTTTTIALVAASGFAFASIVPAASQAAPNTGAFAKSSEGFKYPYGVCVALSKEASREEGRAAQAIATGQLGTALVAATKGAEYVVLGRQGGCGFS